MRTLWKWTCRRGCGHVAWGRKHPKPGAMIYRAPLCKCGVPMQPDPTDQPRKVLAPSVWLRIQ